MSGQLSGTTRLVHIALWRDRWWLPIGAALQGGYVGMLAASMVSAYPDAAARAGAARIIDNPGSTLLLGRRYGPDEYPWGIIVGHQTLGFACLALAVWLLLTVTRHTRSQEESGLLELVRAGRVGRLAPLAAAVIVGLNQALFMSLAVFGALVALRTETVTPSGALAYAVALFATGAFFVAVTALCAQLAPTGRSTGGLAALVLALAFVWRGVFEVRDSDLALASPLAWAGHTQPWWRDDLRWAVPGLLAALLLAGLAAFTASRRELGSSLLRARRGRSAATSALASPLGLALRLRRGSLLVWAVVMAGLGAGYGPVLTNADDFLLEMPALELIVPGAGSATGVEVFASIVVALAALCCAVLGCQAVVRLVADERAGRTPLLLASTSRLKWLSATVMVALLESGLALACFGWDFGASTAMVRDEPELLWQLLGAGLGYLPAVACLIGFTTLLVGLAPRGVWLVWVALGHAFVVLFFASALDWPDWVGWLSPFDHVAARPAVHDDHVAFAVLTVVAAATAVVGAVGYRRRAIG